MAKNPNPTLKNKHHLVVGISGSGKTTWTKNTRDYKAAARLIAWDPDEDYTDLHRVRSIAHLAHALKAAGRRRLRIAVTVDPTPQNFERFCAAVWAIASGKHPIACIWEEAADVMQQGKAGYYSGQLARKGRKYGVQIFVCTQSPAEISKTIYKQCGFKWCGTLDNEIDRKRMALLLGHSVQTIGTLRPGEYFYKLPGPDPAKKGGKPY